MTTTNFLPGHTLYVISGIGGMTGFELTKQIIASNTNYHIIGFDNLFNCDAKKIIIYPDVKYDYITLFNYYSFEKMKVGKKMIELIYKDDLEVLKMDILSQINDEDVCNE